MKILIHGINFLPELTGTGKYTGELAHWLSDRNHAVRVVTAPPYYPQWRIADGYRQWCYTRERVGGMHIVRSPLWLPSRPTGPKRIVHLASFGLSSAPVVLGAATWRPDVIIGIVPTLFSAPFAWLCARLSRAKAWLHVQDLELDAAFGFGVVANRGFKRVAAFLERALLSRFDRVSTISNEMIERLANKGVRRERLRLLPNWVDVGEIHPLERPSTLRAALAGEKGKFVALYSGNMGEKQGLETVIHAARELKDRPDVVFALCGTGAAYKRLREMAADAPNIRWLPLQPAEKLNELLNAADIHLLPQRAGAEGLVMPSKLTGMFASGRPVIATATPGTELASIVAGRGIVIPPGDSAALSRAIRRLADNPEERISYGRAAREYALAHWDREAVLNVFENELKRLTDP